MRNDNKTTFKLTTGGKASPHAVSCLRAELGRQRSVRLGRLCGRGRVPAGLQAQGLPAATRI